jgi:hypothetical protein
MTLPLSMQLHPQNTITMPKRGSDSEGEIVVQRRNKAARRTSPASSSPSPHKSSPLRKFPPTPEVDRVARLGHILKGQLATSLLTATVADSYILEYPASRKALADRQATAVQTQATSLQPTALSSDMILAQSAAMGSSVKHLVLRNQQLEAWNKELSEKVAELSTNLENVEKGRKGREQALVSERTKLAEENKKLKEKLSAIHRLAGESNILTK